MQHLVYALIDPRTDCIRYIGKSSAGLRRPASHAGKRALEKDRTYKGNWIRQLQTLGLTYEVRVLETTSNADLEDAEIRWIAHGRIACWPLTNQTSGGEGLKNPSQEVRDRIGAAHKGRKHSPETIARMQEAHKGKRYRLPGFSQPEEFKEKRRAFRHTPEAKDRIGAAHRGVKRSGETTARMSVSQNSEATQAKRRAALKAFYESDAGLALKAKWSAERIGNHYGRRKP